MWCMLLHTAYHDTELMKFRLADAWDTNKANNIWSNDGQRQKNAVIKKNILRPTIYKDIITFKKTYLSLFKVYIQYKVYTVYST